jgi:uncharacterized membrane protein
LVFSVLFVCSPYIGHQVKNDFHPDAWQIPCLMAALWAWQRKNWPAMLVFVLTAFLAKEDVSFIVTGFAIFLLFRKETRLLGSVVLVGALAVFLFNIKWFVPRYLEGSESLLHGRYYLLGDSFGEMIKNLFVKPSAYIQAFFYEPTKFWRFFCFFLPAAGLTFLAPIFLIPPIISIAPHIMSQATTQLDLSDIYAMPAQPFIFVGAAFGLMVLLRKPLLAQRKALLAGIAFIIAAIGIFETPRYYRHESKHRIAAFKEMKILVPPSAPIAAQQNLLPHFDTRRYVEIFPLGLSMEELQARYFTNPEFVIADRQGNALPYDAPRLQSAIAAMERDVRYAKVFDKENFLLFKRTSSEDLNWSTKNNHEQ